MDEHYNGREYSAFLDRVRDRARKSPHRFAERNRWVEPIQVTRVKNYDRATDEARAVMINNERETAA